MTESVARMAQVEYQMQMAKLQNSRGRRSDKDMLIEKFKIEDWWKFEPETT